VTSLIIVSCQLKSIFRRRRFALALRGSVTKQNSLARNEMLPENKIIVSCLILFSIFQLYQVYSSFTSVYLDDDNNWQYHKHGLLTAFNIICLLTSSFLLIVGSLKSKPWFLIGGLSYLVYKLVFIFWHFGKFYDMTIGCEKNCLPGHLEAFVKHLAVTGE
jgi:hypothetical protein